VRWAIGPCRKRFLVGWRVAALLGVGLKFIQFGLEPRQLVRLGAARICTGGEAGDADPGDGMLERLLALSSVSCAW
jgi:hypothetical protein